MKKFNAKTFYNLFFGFIILAILAKVYQYTMMKAYSFGIMTRLLNWLYTDIIPIDNSYAFPLKIYRYIRFLGFSTNLEWSIFWTIIMNFIFLVLVINHKDKYSTEEFIFIFASMFILDVFVFNMNKDLIQCLVLLIVYAIMKNKKLKNPVKVCMVALLFIWESICFRPYYILIGGLLVLNYFTLGKIISSRSKITKKKVIFSIIITLIIMFAGIFVMQFVVPDSYNQLVHRRDNLENDIDANTVILDWIKGDNFITYCLNYCINFVRICIPIELVFKGKFYIIFVVYQLYLTWNLIKGIKNIDKKTLCYKAFILAYWMTLVASESDFGTLVRHQSILFMCYLMLVKDNKDAEKKC